MSASAEAATSSFGIMAAQYIASLCMSTIGRENHMRAQRAASILLAIQTEAANETLVEQLALRPHLVRSVTDPLVSRQFVQSHRTARADLVGADADFRTHAEFSAVSETRRGVPINRGGIDLIEKSFRRRFVLRHDAVGVRGAVVRDVI